MAAAEIAAQSGKRITIIDKGPYGFSGASGYNWDCYATWLQNGPPEFNYSNPADNLVSSSLVYNAVNAKTWNELPLHFLNLGQVLPFRHPDGSLEWYYERPIVDDVALRFFQGTHFRSDMDTVRGSAQVVVADKTIATDFVIQDNRCVGVACLHLPTGRYKVYRSDATIVSTGAPCWFYGWTGVSAQSINCTDNTGDLDMAAYRRGIGVGHCEFAAYDFTTVYPKGLGYGWGTCIDCDGNEPYIFGDKDGNPLFTEPNATDFTVNRADFNRYLANEIVYNGIADEKDQLRAVIKGHEIRPSFQVNIPLLEKFGVDPVNENLPTHCEMFERSSTPIVDEKMMTPVEGLFHARGAGSTSPTASLTSSASNALLAPYTAKCAVEYVDEAPQLSEIDLSSVLSEFERLEEIMRRNPKNSIRPFEVRHMIQETCGVSLGSIRRKADLEATATELERIRKDELPRMKVSSLSKNYNTEWKEAIENYNLLDEAELMVKATLQREESRGQYLFVEFPDEDEDWNCMLVATKDGDGVAFEKIRLNETD